ncbi:MAG TPA: NADH-ubiquinone oxidoreductase-F iron-sulfur binding region domain-containing protein, partial [Candidatus Limnocylindria bacterium]|nr:NADH-ubiquinone oxidoreductase-F iron-sulfur binding region domain-containing protein [Candidatus Limnocylindria bacterium]
VCRRLSVPPAEAYGVATFYALFTTKPRAPIAAHVCDDIACRLAGAEEVCEDLGRSLGPAGSPARDGTMTWLRSPCLGQCERVPAAMFTIAGEQGFREVAAPTDAVGIVSRLEAAVAGDRSTSKGPSERPVGDPAAATQASTDRMQEARASVPQAGEPQLQLLRRAGIVDPSSLDDYLANRGYQALEHALAMGPEAVTKEVIDSKLLGRGGAAFPTGRKWAAVAGQPAQPHYVVANADESEPGTFSNRVVMELDPFAVVESMTIEGLATRSSKGYLYIRGEYPLAEGRILHAIEAARAAGYLGPSVMGSDFAFDIELRRGAGAYICGEETALFESIEGKRGEPRNKPPFPVEVGLFGKPTAVNNVETLVNVLGILEEGPGGGERYAATGTDGSTGPKLFCVSGNVGRAGVYEVTFGMTLGELIELAGGVPGGRSIRAVLLGGAAGVFVGPDALEVPLTFEGTRAIGASLGSGVVMVFDETTDMVGTLRRIAAFFRDESCGQCVPCRVGTVRQEELLSRLADRIEVRTREAELALLRDIGQAMRDASICGLGQTASSAIESAMRQPELVAL